MHSRAPLFTSRSCAARHLRASLLDASEEACMPWASLYAVGRLGGPRLQQQRVDPRLGRVLRESGRLHGFHS